MTAVTSSLAPINDTDPHFRSWGSGVAALLSGTGALTQTADTGQINWTTVTRPTVANTAQGYEIWRFNDTLQSTVPVYFKIEYGGGTSLGAAPQMWLTVGTGTDGAGTITGTIQARAAMMSASNNWSTGTASTCYANGASADAAVVVTLWAPNTTGNGTGGWFLFERSRDWDGAPSGDGLVLYAASAGTASNNWTIRNNWRFFNTGFASDGNGSAFDANIAATTAGLNLATLIKASDTYFYGVAHCFTGWKIGAPSKYLIGYSKADVPLSTTVAVSIYGTSYNWFTIGSNTPTGNNTSFAFRTS